VHVDPIRPKLKPPGTQRLKLNCDVLLSTSAFEFNLRRYMKVAVVTDGERILGEAVQVEPVKPTLKAPESKRLKVNHVASL
jgi:hypothetical protein